MVIFPYEMPNHLLLLPLGPSINPGPGRMVGERQSTTLTRLRMPQIGDVVLLLGVASVEGGGG